MSYHNKHIIFKKNIGIITQIWQSQMLFYMRQQHMVPDYCTKYKMNPFFSEISQQIHKKCMKKWQ